MLWRLARSDLDHQIQVAHKHAEICYLSLSSLDSILSDKGCSLAR